MSNNNTESKKKGKVVPSKPFLVEINDLVDANDFTGALLRECNWYVDNCPDADSKLDFNMFANLLANLMNFHEQKGHFPYGELRQDISYEMRKLAEYVFGGYVVWLFRHAGDPTVCL